MADIKSPKDRSRNMAAIHSSDTKPEIILRKRLWNLGYRYRKNYKALPGKPDIVLTKYKICIFVDSEFFHGKGFYSGYESKKYSSLEEQLKHSNHPDFWLNKIRRNMEHDQHVDTQLKEMGWIVLRFWSKDVIKQTDNCIASIEETIKHSQ
jgi:DNA mismatch endonuclease (patch repair protein)